MELPLEPEAFGRSPGSSLELSAEKGPKGKHALRWSATVNPKHAYVVLDRRGDFSGYNALEVWVKPEVEDGTYALDVRVCVWDPKRRRGAWFTVGSINHHTAPNRRWTRLVFYLGDVPWRERTLRPVDIVAWGHSPHHRKGERLVFYFGGFRLLLLRLERSGLLLNGGSRRHSFLGGFWPLGGRGRQPLTTQYTLFGDKGGGTRWSSSSGPCSFWLGATSTM